MFLQLQCSLKPVGFIFFFSFQPGVFEILKSGIVRRENYIIRIFNLQRLL